MKRAWIVLLLCAGCSPSAGSPAAGAPPEPAKAAPEAPVKARNISKPDGILLTGLPESPELASCDYRGRWGLAAPKVDHWLVDPSAEKAILPEENSPRLSLFRDSLPFPQLNWKSGDWEVTELLYPVGKGFAARYHVMNHGENAKTAQLKIGARDGGDGPSIAALDKPAAATLTFDVKVEPGVSQFITVTTPDLAGKVSDDALDQAAERWEKLFGARGLKLPDSKLLADYYGALAGQALGVTGCGEAARAIEQRIAKADGKAIRLLPGMPETWHLESIEARELPTEFGPLSFRYQGAYNNRTYQLKPGCAPPGGFLIEVPEKLVAKVDGKDAAVKDGLITVPAGASFVEVSTPR